MRFDDHSVARLHAIAHFDTTGQSANIGIVANENLASACGVSVEGLMPISDADLRREAPCTVSAHLGTSWRATSRLVNVLETDSVHAALAAHHDRGQPTARGGALWH